MKYHPKRRNYDTMFVLMKRSCAESVKSSCFPCTWYRTWIEGFGTNQFHISNFNPLPCYLNSLCLDTIIQSISTNLNSLCSVVLDAGEGEYKLFFNLPLILKSSIAHTTVYWQSLYLVFVDPLECMLRIIHMSSFKFF